MCLCVTVSDRHIVSIRTSNGKTKAAMDHVIADPYVSSIPIVATGRPRIIKVDEAVSWEWFSRRERND